DLTLAVHEGRADGKADVRNVQVAVVDDLGIVLVEHVPDVPVEEALADLERTLEGGGEPPRGLFGVGRARHFPAAATPVDRGRAAGRVEVAQRRHRGTDRGCRRLGRITRDLARRLTLGVA